MYSTFRSIHGVAADWGLAPPINRGAVRLPHVTPTAIEVATITQIRQLADVIDPRFSAAVVTAGFCGLRQSELLGLHPGDVEWLRYRIRIHQTLEKATHRRVEETKSGRERMVTMPERVAHALAEHVREHPCTDYVFHHGGRPVDATWFHRSIWNPARQAVGLPDLHFHSLRHSAATIMAAAGWGPKRVQTELGHSDPAFTLRCYSHLFATDDEVDRRRMDALLAGHGHAQVTSREANR